MPAQYAQVINSNDAHYGQWGMVLVRDPDGSMIVRIDDVPLSYGPDEVRLLSDDEIKELRQSDE